VLRALGMRLLTASATLLLITIAVFALAHLTPGDPLEREDDPAYARLTPSQRAEMRQVYGLDEPPVRRYFVWLGSALRGNLGLSFHDRRPVREKILERMGPTVALNACSLLLMILLAVPLGAAAALRPGSFADRWSGGLTYLLYAVPVFWAAPLLQMLFSVKLGLLPLFGLRSDGATALPPLSRAADTALHLVLPVFCLTYGGLAHLSRFVRANLLESGLRDSALAARARGRSPLGVLVKHGFRQSAVPMLTLAGFLLPALFGGSVIVESIFALHGLGGLFYDSILARDLPVLLGLTLLSGSATLLGVLAADLLYVVVDPRTRRG
jgi:peptide/nickel transport system permease protein